MQLGSWRQPRGGGCGQFVCGRGVGVRGGGGFGVGVASLGVGVTGLGVETTGAGVEAVGSLLGVETGFGVPEAGVAAGDSVGTTTELSNVEDGSGVASTTDSGVRVGTGVGFAVSLRFFPRIHQVPKIAPPNINKSKAATGKSHKIFRFLCGAPAAGFLAGKVWTLISFFGGSGKTGVGSGVGSGGKIAAR